MKGENVEPLPATAYLRVNWPPPPCAKCGDRTQDSLFRIQVGKGAEFTACINCLFREAKQSKPGDIRIVQIIEWIDRETTWRSRRRPMIMPREERTDGRRKRGN